MFNLIEFMNWLTDGNSQSSCSRRREQRLHCSTKILLAIGWIFDSSNSM